jgi:GTPase
MTTTQQTKTGYVAIVGEPNVGKSTLLNALLRQKLSIVAKKPQTTRQRVLGILTIDEAQIIFLDTPGLLHPTYLLQEKMMVQAEMALSDADVIIVMTEASRGVMLHEQVEKVILQRSSRTPIFLVINKADTLHRPLLLPVIEAFAQQQRFQEIFPVSALKRENLDDLLSTVIRYLPEHPLLYPSDIVSEHPERFFVAEFIREKIFEDFHEEIPYSVAVEIREFKERERGKTFISADIIVERDSQKGIVIGKNGESLKTVGRKARQAIEEFLGRPVFLELFVKVGKKWRENEQWLQRLGYSKESNDIRSHQ